jgi:hypothetical protein
VGLIPPHGKVGLILSHSEVGLIPAHGEVCSIPAHGKVVLLPPCVEVSLIPAHDKVVFKVALNTHKFIMNNTFCISVIACHVMLYRIHLAIGGIKHTLPCGGITHLVI